MMLKLSGVALAVSQAFTPLAMAQAKADDAAVVVVTGIRASARSAVAIKKDTMEIMDAVTAEDIGKLPDTNLAEVLARIPGVQGYRFAGEGSSPFGQGSGLTIRGLVGLTASHLNGRSFATAGSREFNLEGANPAMIAGVDVYKNPSSEHIEGAIGGLMNVKSRNPSDFKGPTGGFAINAKYNDFAKKTDPEYFGMLANRWDLGGGQRLGVMVGGSYTKSTNRNDNNPAGGRNPTYRRVVPATSAEYATLAAANTSNNPSQALTSYIGRSDISLLTGVNNRPTSSTVGAHTPDLSGLTAAQIENVIAAPTLFNNVFQETIMRERKGLNLAADYRVSPTLRFYAEANYVSYLYHQHYRGLNQSNSNGNVQNLQTAPFAMTELLANRNFNGGSNEVLTSKRLVSGSFLNQTVNTLGGIEKSPYETTVGAVGADWNPTSDLSLRLDYSYTTSERKKDNRSASMDSAPGLSWTVNRVADGSPHQLTFSGPDLSNPNNFVFNQYGNGDNTLWDDDGSALALSGAWSTDLGIFNRIKFGTRIANQSSETRQYGFGGLRLTTDGQGRSTANQILVGSKAGTWELAPNNFMHGEAGYAGGYVVYSPTAIWNDQVRAAFPNAGIAAAPYAERLNDRKLVEEDTYAAYVSGDFAAFDDRLRGNVGVRAVRTESAATGRVLDRTVTPNTMVDRTVSTSYVNYLPSLNVSYDLAKDFMLRFGYGKGMTRAAPGDLDTNISVDLARGTGSMGNPNLRPQTANSYDISLERYFSPTNYVALGIFQKDIKGFFNNVIECATVPNVPLYAGTEATNCSNGQYEINRRVNSDDGYAKGFEVSGQWFFDSNYAFLKNFGVSGSYSYIDTSIPVNTNTVAAPRLVDVGMPFVSKNSYSLQAMYEDRILSARLAYTYRSDHVLFGVGANPIENRNIRGYGMLSAAVNYKLNEQLTLSFNANNLTDVSPSRDLGEPGLKSGLEYQHFANGRVFTLGLRYTFGNK
jgi:TonB-dependent receptor